MTKYYVDQAGNYLGGFDGAEPPINSIEVQNPPDNGKEKWIGGKWILDSATQIEELKKQIDEMERKELLPRSARETFILVVTALAPSLGYTSAQVAKLPAMVAWKTQDALAVNLRAQINSLS